MIVVEKMGNSGLVVKETTSGANLLKHTHIIVRFFAGGSSAATNMSVTCQIGVNSEGLDYDDQPAQAYVQVVPPSAGWNEEWRLKEGRYASCDLNTNGVAHVDLVVDIDAQPLSFTSVLPGAGFNGNVANLVNITAGGPSQRYFASVIGRDTRGNAVHIIIVVEQDGGGKVRIDGQSGNGGGGTTESEE